MNHNAIVPVSPGNPTGVTSHPSGSPSSHLGEGERSHPHHRRDLLLFRPPSAAHLFDDPPRRDVIACTALERSRHPRLPRRCSRRRRTARLEALKILDCVAICAHRSGRSPASPASSTPPSGDGSRRAIAIHQQRFESVMADRPGGFELVAAGAYFGWVRYPGNSPPTTPANSPSTTTSSPFRGRRSPKRTTHAAHQLRQPRCRQIDRPGERLAEWSHESTLYRPGIGNTRPVRAASTATTSSSSTPPMWGTSCGRGRGRRDPRRGDPLETPAWLRWSAPDKVVRGRNYLDHIEEMGATDRQRDVFRQVRQLADRRHRRSRPPPVEVSTHIDWRSNSPS